MAHKFKPGEEITITVTGKLDGGCNYLYYEVDGVPAALVLNNDLLGLAVSNTQDDQTTRRRKFVEALRNETRPQTHGTVFSPDGGVCPVGVASSLFGGPSNFTEQRQNPEKAYTVAKKALGIISSAELYRPNDYMNMSFSDQADYWAKKWGL